MAALRIGIALVVTIVWAAVYGRYVYDPSIGSPPAELSGVMLAVVTWTLTAEFRSRTGSIRAALRRFLDEQEGGRG